MSIDKIIDKCKKLLALAKDCSNENESAAAMRQLQKLLAKHNLSLTEVEKEESEISESKFSYGSGGIWARIILQYIANVYFCKIYFFKHPVKQHEIYTFVGSELNRMVAMEMGVSAVKLINKLANKGAKESGGGKIDYKFRVSFRNGAAYRIKERCEEMIKAAQEGNLEDEDGNKLPAIRSLYENQLSIVQDFMDSQKNLKNHRSKTRSSCPNGTREGVAAGNRVPIKNNLLKNSSTKLLGNKMQKYILGFVYQSDYGQPPRNICKGKKVYIPVPGGIYTEKEINEFQDSVVLEVVINKINNKEYVSVKPKGNKRWLMFGGTFVWSSDSRARNSYFSQPVPIHDRFEG